MIDLHLQHAQHLGFGKFNNFSQFTSILWTHLAKLCKTHQHLQNQDPLLFFLFYFGVIGIFNVNLF